MMRTSPPRQQQQLAGAAAALAAPPPAPPIPMTDAAGTTDVSAGLVSRVHCTADGHIAIAVDHGVPPAPPLELPPEARPPPACPPSVCLDVGRRYLAAVLSGVTGGLTEAVWSELRAMLHPQVEVRVGISGAAPPGQGVEHFMTALRADNSAYDNWRMTLLSAAAPPSGGEVFLWVDETARNVGVLPGLDAPTHRTSRSLTLHRLLLDSAGHITQAWARYQLFEEMRRLMLLQAAEPSAPEDMMEVEPPPGGAVHLEGAGGGGPAPRRDGGGGGGGGGGAAAAPDLTALPFVQWLMEGVAGVAATAAGHGPQGEGAAAQAQAAYAVVTAGEAPLPEPAAASSSAAMAAGQAAAQQPGSAPASCSPLLRSDTDESQVPVADFEAQAGRSVATWLGLVDSSYSGVRDVFGAMSEELALWDALGLWPHLRGARGRDQVLEELQHLHMDYDIRIRRGTWAVDRQGRVAFCFWEAQAVPLKPAGGAGPVAEPTGAAGGEATQSPGVGAGDIAGEGNGEAAAAAAAPTPTGGMAGAPYIFTSLDVYGLSVQGHVTDVVMYRTALPGEAEHVFKKQLLQPPASAVSVTGADAAAADAKLQQQQQQQQQQQMLQREMTAGAPAGVHEVGGLGTAGGGLVGA